MSTVPQLRNTHADAHADVVVGGTRTDRKDA